MKCESEWGIIGGGILGMTLALRLAEQGCKVTLFEAAEQIGGLASAWQLDDVVWDRHYHVTLLSDATLRGLLSELGLEAEMRWVTTRTGFYTGGRLYSMSNSLEFLRFPPLGLIGKLRLAATIVRASLISDGKALEKIPVAEWLERWSGRKVFETIWLPLLRSKLGDSYRITSATFIWTTIARMYAARRSGLKKEMFGYVPGGYARILERFHQALAAKGVEVRTGQPARCVQPLPGGGLQVSFANGAERRFDNLVITTPAPTAARLCPELSEDEKSRLNSLRYQGVVCASVLLKKPLAGFYVTNITDTGVPFTAVVEMSALVDRSELGGHHLVYLPKYVSPDDPFFDLPDEEIERRFLDALLRMYPHLSPGDVLCFRVSRVRHVFALLTLGYSELLAPTVTSVPGLFLVNSGQLQNGTLNVNETLDLAGRALPALTHFAQSAASVEATS